MNRELTPAAERNGLLIDWLLRFEEAAEAGTPVAPAALCQERPDLLPAFKALLEKVGWIDAILGTEPPPPAGSEPLPPDTDRYHFEAFLARGGMGEVYRGRDGVLNRTVAIKVLRRRLGVSADQFRAEAELVAGLSHPGIVPVYDSGELPDGRPFFAMRLIEGRTLEAVLTDAEARGESPANQLQRFEQICQAVAFAHGRHPPLLHRDLKPQNVMVGAFGEVQVMDWGIARTATAFRQPTGDAVGERPPPTGAGDESTLDQTKTGVVKGTWAYMAPEQARGRQAQVGTATDVFALGGILCRILTGRPTFWGEAATARAAAGDLSETFARLGGCGAAPDLVALAKRFLTPDAADRIPDAGAAATAVAAYRTNLEERLRRTETDLARTEARAVELRKRRRAQAGLAAALLTLVAGGGLAAWWYDREAARRQSEEQLQSLAERERVSRNEQAMESALAQAEDALRRDDAAAAAVPLEQVARRVPDGASEATLARFGRCKQDVTTIEELDRVDDFRWTAVGNRFPEHRLTAEKWHAAFAAYGIAPDRANPGPAAERIGGSTIRARLLATLDVWLSWEPGDAVLALLAAADPDAHRGAVRRAIRRGGGAELERLDTAEEAADQPGHFELALGQVLSLPVPERQRHLAAALRRNPGHFVALVTMAEVHRDRPAESAGWYRAALAIRPTNSAAWNNLGAALNATRDLAGAVACYREAIRLDPNTAFPHFNLGKALEATEDVGGAIASFHKTLELDPAYAPAHNELGLAFQRQSKPDAAIAAYRKAIALDPTLAASRTNLGNVFRERGDLAGAIAEYREALARDPGQYEAHDNLGIVLRERADWAEAVTASRKALEFHPKNAQWLCDLGNALARTKRPAEAIAAYRDAIRLAPKFAGPHYDLGRVLREMNDLEGAVAAFQESLRLVPKMGSVQAMLGYALREQGRLVEAERELTAARQSYRPDAPAQPEIQSTLTAVTALLAADEKKLAEVVAGRAEPATAAESIRLAQLCGRSYRRYALAQRLFAEAFRIDDRLKTQPLLGHRYTAARFAALAAEGKGIEAPAASDRSRSRETARAWLTDDLAARTAIFEQDSLGHRDPVHAQMRDWLTEPDLAGLRDPEKLQALLADERRAWEKLWRTVEALRDRTAPAKKPLNAPEQNRE